MRLGETAREFLPYALGHQGIGFAAFHHAPHERHGVGCHIEAESRREACKAQDADGVFGERFAHVAQHARLEISLAAERVDERAILGFRHGVDRQVSAPEIFFEGNLGSGVDLEPLVAAPALAFGARERVFLMRAWMKEDRKVLAYGFEALRDHFPGRGAHYDVVALLHRQSEELIPDRTAHEIDVHRVAYGSSAATNSVSRRAASHHSRTAASPCTASQYACARLGT